MKGEQNKCEMTGKYEETHHIYQSYLRNKSLFVKKLNCRYLLYNLKVQCKKYIN